MLFRSGVAFCVALGFGILIPVIPVFARTFEVSALQASAVVSVFALVRFVTSPLSGGLVDRFGERLVMGTGLLITDLIGFGINQVTGDYSRGASGFWVEGGAIAYPVEEITVAGNLLEMYRNIIAIGADVDLRANIRTGSVLVDGMTIAGE